MIWMTSEVRDFGAFKELAWDKVGLAIVRSWKCNVLFGSRFGGNTEMNLFIYLILVCVPSPNLISVQFVIPMQKEIDVLPKRSSVNFFSNRSVPHAFFYPQETTTWDELMEARMDLDASQGFLMVSGDEKKQENLLRICQPSSSPPTHTTSTLLSLKTSLP